MHVLFGHFGIPRQMHSLGPFLIPLSITKALSIVYSPFHWLSSLFVVLEKQAMCTSYCCGILRVGNSTSTLSTFTCRAQVFHRDQTRGLTRNQDNQTRCHQRLWVFKSNRFISRDSTYDIILDIHMFDRLNDPNLVCSRLQSSTGCSHWTLYDWELLYQALCTHKVKELWLPSSSCIGSLF